MTEPTKKKVKYSRNALELVLKRLSGDDVGDIKGSFREMLEAEHELHPSAKGVLESLLEVMDSSVSESIPTIQASRLTLSEALHQVGIDYQPQSLDYLWQLKDEDKCKEKSLSEWASTAIRKIDTSKYMKEFRPESLVRTLVDIFLCDRLELLDDAMSYKHLKVIPETQVDAKTKDGACISGRADWVLGYADDKARLHEMLLVVEAKRPHQVGAALSQLLIYLAGVQQARSKAEKENVTVFGIATDAIEYRFVMLRSDRKAFVSKTLHSKADTGMVVSFLDQIIEDAIQSSPHTTLTRRQNRRIRNFEPSLRSSYVFAGSDPDEEKKEEDDEFWQIDEVDGISVLQPEKDLKPRRFP